LKPPRSVWVLVPDGIRGSLHVCESEREAQECRAIMDTIVRYDLHRPKKRKARKGERSKR
jgi:hypothetical protein